MNIKYIAEIGLNHFGSEETAMQMVNASIAADVNAITFQIRENNFYQSDDVRKKKLNISFYEKIIKICHASNIQFGIAIAEIDLIEDFDKIGIDFWKTLSWDFGNIKMFEILQKTKKQIYISTGLTSAEQIIDFKVKKSELLENSILIHTQLSQEIENVNLKAIESLRYDTKLPVAFGLHCKNHEVLKLALSYDPFAIFTYVKQADSEDLFDREHAIHLDDLKLKITELRLLNKAKGDGFKKETTKPNWVV